MFSKGKNRSQIKKSFAFRDRRASEPLAEAEAESDDLLQ
jgi:hypothetical protein